MKKTLRFFFAALAAAVGLSAQAATDFVGVYEFSSTTTVLNSLNGWEQCAVSDFTFSVDVNKGEDAAKYPYVVKNFLPQKGHPYGVEVNNLKAEVSADGQSLAIVVGDEGLLLDNTPHLCAWSGQGKDGGEGVIMLTANGTNFTMNDIVITWHQKIDMGFFVDDSSKDLVRYSSIKIKKSEAGAVDFTGTYAFTSTKDFIDDRFMQGYWLMPEFTFTITPNMGEFDERYEFIVNGFMTLNKDLTPAEEEETTDGDEDEEDNLVEAEEGEDQGEGGEGEGGEGDEGGEEPPYNPIVMTQSLPAYRSTDGQSLIICMGEDHHLLEGGTHFCAWSGREGRQDDKDLITMSLAGDGQGYVFNDDLCFCYHNLIWFGDFLFADECYVAAVLTDAYVEKLSDDVDPVEGVSTATLRTPSAVTYDLMGRSVNAAKAHGLFIKNGKKVLVK